MQFFLQRVTFWRYTLAIMKTSVSSVGFTPSKTTAQQLEELCRITQRTPQAIVEEIVSFELQSMFGSTDDSADQDADLQRYLYRQNYSPEQKGKVAAAYNAFTVRRAQATGRQAMSAAVVESNRLWFPLVTSRVEKSARQARKALQAVGA